MKARHLSLSIFFVGIILYPFSAISQTTDYELWSGVSVTYKVAKKHRLELEQQVRFDDRISSVKNTFTAFGWRWKMNKRFSFTPTYRYTFVPNDDNHGRISADLNYSWDKKKFPLRVKNRLRYQNRSPFDGDRRKSYLRNKLSFEYNASKLVDPFIAGEIFYRLDRRNEFRIWRFNTGLTWRINKRVDVRTFYRLEQEFNKKSNDRFHIFGLDLAWKIN
ncbi:MAG: DUF2490 domain-containing protein [bacterium]|nr:DUF2490 domain-containing protein [bacterium]